MTAPVPSYRPEILPTAIKAGKNVSAGATMLPAGQLANYLAGAGAVLVPACSPNKSVGAGTSRVFSFWVKAPPATVRLAWYFTLRATGGDYANVQIVTGLTTASYRAFASRASVTVIEHFQNLSAKPTGEEEISCTISPTGNGVQVESISVLAMPRVALDQDTTDYGVALETLNGTRPIYDATSSGTGAESVGNLARHSAVLRTIARRAGHFHLAMPQNISDAIQVTTGAPSWQTILADGPALLNRMMYRSTTTGLLGWKVCAATSSGGAGNVKVTMTNGDTDTIAVTSSTSFQMYPTVGGARTFDVNCEDMTQSDGRLSGADDIALIEANVTAGTLYLATVSIIEP